MCKAHSPSISNTHTHTHTHGGVMLNVWPVPRFSSLGCGEAHVQGTLTIHLQHTHTHTACTRTRAHTHTHTHGLFQDSPPLSGLVFPFTDETCHSDSDYQSQTLFKEGLHEITTCLENHHHTSSCSCRALRKHSVWMDSLYFKLMGVQRPDWRRKWQPTPVFLPGESHGRGSLVGCRLWGRTESDMTEAT